LIALNVIYNDRARQIAGCFFYVVVFYTGQTALRRVKWEDDQIFLIFVFCRFLLYTSIDTDHGEFVYARRGGK
jgi:hypothetical protein